MLKLKTIRYYLHNCDMKLNGALILPPAEASRLIRDNDGGDVIRRTKRLNRSNIIDR